MKKYHINGNGEAWPCNATKDGCPFGGDANHFPTPQAARAFYEGSQSSFPALSSHEKLEPPYRDTVLQPNSESVRPLVNDLAELFRRFERQRVSWIADDTFSCDGGAVAAVLLARKHGLDAELHVGLYVHNDPEVRGEMLGLERDDDESEEDWQERLEEETDGLMEEHHHWAVIHTDEGSPLLFDGNAAAREEEYVIPEEETYDRYLDGAEHLVYDPADDVHEIARDLYPGLEEAIEAVYADSKRSE